MNLKLPKSVPESKKYVVWAFPLLIGFGAAEFLSGTWQQRIAILVCLLVVFTGWSSFAVVEENIYNDILLFCDLALLSSYLLLLSQAGQLEHNFGNIDVGLWSSSAAIFGFYAVWDLVALGSEDTRELATGLHLKRAAIICVGGMFVFIAGAIFLSRGAATGMPHWVTVFERVVILLFWIATLCWWHQGRVRAAISDSKPPKAEGTT